MSTLSPIPAPAPLPGQAAPAVPQIRLEMLSNPLLLSGAREMVAAVAKRLGFTDEACGQIALAVDEALCNVIRHGYNREASRPIWLSIFAVGNGWEAPPRPGAGGDGLAKLHAPPGAGGEPLYPEALRIIIEDEAAQVDPSKIKSRDLDEVRPGGLGVHIIKSVMDEAVYERRERIGMRLTMLKKRVGSAAGRTPALIAAAERQAAKDASCSTGGCHG